MPAARTAAVVAGGLLVLLPFTLLEYAIEPRYPFSLLALGLVVLAAVVPALPAPGPRA